METEINISVYLKELFADAQIHAIHLPQSLAVILNFHINRLDIEGEYLQSRLIKKNLCLLCHQSQRQKTNTLEGLRTFIWSGCR